MRDIKFRAWDGNRMRDVFKIVYHIGVEGYMHFTDTQSNEPGHLRMSDERLRAMQYTGLKDKNGKEIYEGDVVNDDDSGKGIVIFQSGCFFMMYDADTNMEFLGLKTDKFGRLQQKRVVKIIGHIY